MAIFTSHSLAFLAHTNRGGDIMSPKELTYIQDALGHEKFLKTQCDDAIQKLQDGELKNKVQQMAQSHQQMFDSFYNLI